MSCASALRVPSAFCSNFKTHSESSHFSLPVPLLCWLEEHSLLPGLLPPLCPPHPHLWPGPSPTAAGRTASAPNLAALHRFPTVKAKDLLKALNWRSVSLTRLPPPARLAPALFPPSPKPSSGAFVLPLAWDTSPHSLLLAFSTSRSLRMFSYWRRLPHRPPSFKKIDFPFGESPFSPTYVFLSVPATVYHTVLFYVVSLVCLGFSVLVLSAPQPPWKASDWAPSLLSSRARALLVLSRCPLKYAGYTGAHSATPSLIATDSCREMWRDKRPGSMWGQTLTAPDTLCWWSGHSQWTAPRSSSRPAQAVACSGPCPIGGTRHVPDMVSTSPMLSVPDTGGVSR